MKRDKSSARKHVRWLMGAALTMTTIVSNAARSDDTSAVLFGGEYKLSIQSDRTLNTSGGNKPFTNTYTEPELGWYVNAGQHFAINGNFKMEQVRTVSQTKTFKEEGAYVEQFYATVSFNPIDLYAGKIHPRFGRAWDITSGLYGTDFAEDYELTEKIGIGTAVHIRQFGVHRLSLEAFHADTSFFSRSVISRPIAGQDDTIRPGRARRGDGGVSNTGDIGNFAVALEGRNMPNLKGFAYNLGMAVQKGSTIGGERDERSHVAGISWEFPLTRRMTVTPIFEYAHVGNQGGAGTDADYYTAGAKLELGLGWAVSAHGTIRSIDIYQPPEEDGTPDKYRDSLYGASVSYDLGALLKQQSRLFDGLAVEAGVKRERVAREHLGTVGMAFVYERKF